MAALGDLYVNDAFSAAHRAHASTEGLAHALPAFAGRQMEAELDALDKALGNPEHPVAAVVGGAKVSTKLDVLQQPGRQGRSPDHRRRHGQYLPRRARRRCGQVACASMTWPATADEILDAAERASCTVHLPYDVVVAKEFAPNPPSLRTVNVHEVAADEMILDIGPARDRGAGGRAQDLPHPGVERPARRLRDAAVRYGAPSRLAKTAAALTKEGRWSRSRRRRYGGGAQSGGRGGRLHLRLDCRGGLPRMDGRQGTAGRRGAATGARLNRGRPPAPRHLSRTRFPRG